jgi:hypothetical protein
MPNILSGFGKACKMKEFVLEMDNYYDVQRLKRNNKVFQPVTFLIDHAFE